MTEMSERGSRLADRSRLVWDLPVRIFHWVLVLAVIGAFVTNRLCVAYFHYHLLCGYTVIVAVLFRVVWGFVGTRHARFADFIRGPREIWRYLRALLRRVEAVHAGHNPLGGLMVIALLGGLLLQAGLGLFSNDEIFNAGPFNALLGHDLSRLVSSLHRRLFYLIAAAIVLHVGAVLWHQWGKKEDLLRPMITGRKRLQGAGITSSRLGLAMLLAVAVTGAFLLVLGQAPAPASGNIY